MSLETGNPIAMEQAESAITADRTFDNLSDAMDALDGIDLEDGLDYEAPETATDDQPGDPVEDDEEEPDEELSEETEEAETEEAGDDDLGDPEPLEFEPERKLRLEDGTEVTFEELTNGNLRQADYTRKTEALAEERKELETLKMQTIEQGTQIKQTYQGLLEFLNGIIPAEPSLDLLSQNQQEYLRQQAIRKAFTDELNQVIGMQGKANDQIQQFASAEMTQVKAAEEKKLVDVMPSLGDPLKMQNFLSNVQKTAVEMGFSAEEAAQTYDHRLLRLVHLAGIGQKTLENGKNARRRIKEKAATPAQKKPVKSAAKQSSNGKAMRRLSQSGSIDDAMMIDFL